MLTSPQLQEKAKSSAMGHGSRSSVPHSRVSCCLLCTVAMSCRVMRSSRRSLDVSVSLSVSSCPSWRMMRKCLIRLSSRMLTTTLGVGVGK